jgi:hypothetical protein
MVPPLFLLIGASLFLGGCLAAVGPDGAPSRTDSLAPFSSDHIVYETVLREWTDDSPVLDARRKTYEGASAVPPVRDEGRPYPSAWLQHWQAAGLVSNVCREEACEPTARSPVVLMLSEISTDRDGQAFVAVQEDRSLAGDRGSASGIRFMLGADRDGQWTILERELLWDVIYEVDRAGISEPDVEMLEAAIAYYRHHLFRSSTQLADSVLAVDTLPARATTFRGPPLDPMRAVHAPSDLLKEVAARIGSPIRSPADTECRPVDDPRGAYCSVIGAAGVVGVGRILVEGDHAQVEVRAWLPSELPRQRADIPEGRLRESLDVISLERVGGEWKAVSIRPLAIS